MVPASWFVLFDFSDESRFDLLISTFVYSFRISTPPLSRGAKYRIIFHRLFILLFKHAGVFPHFLSFLFFVYFPPLFFLYYAGLITSLPERFEVDAPASSTESLADHRRPITQGRSLTANVSRQIKKKQQLKRCRDNPYQLSGLLRHYSLFIIFIIHL